VSFRSIDHSSPVTVTLSPEQTKELLPKPAWSGDIHRYDDSSLRATIAHLQAEISLMQESLKDKPAPETPDYTWITDHVNEFKDILKALKIDKEIPTNLWNESFSRALSSALPAHQETTSVVFPEGIPGDPILRASAIISSFGLVTISILLMLQYIYN
jgi:hypothetical protein